jgi:hypothetical protein
MTASLLLSVRGANAQGTGTDGIVSEVRLGLLAHDLHALGGVENGADVNGEVLFVSPVPDTAVQDLPSALRWLLQPRPHVGFDANTSGYTDQFYAGATWTLLLAQHVLTPDDGLFLDLGGGGAVNDGHTSTSLPNRKQLGSNVLFHLSAELGYRFARRWSVSAYFEHSSNADLSYYNESLNEAGMRIGFRF